MKTIFMSAAALSLASTLALAQQATSPTPQTTQPPAVGSPAPSSPAPQNTIPNGTITESQVRERLSTNGYTNPGTLTQDPNGLWRGTAMKDGRSITIVIDRQGNITQQ